MKHGILLVFFFLVLSLAACSGENQKQTATQAPPAQPSNAAGSSRQPQQDAGFKSVPPQVAKQLLDAKKDTLIVDVRTPQELREGAIAGSTMVPFWSVMRGQHTLPRDKPLLIVCAVGGRSYAVGQVLSRQGYSNVYNLSGGIAAWKKAGLPVVY